MFCRELNEHVSPYLDGLLSPAMSRKVEEHTSVCPRCRHGLQLMKEIPVVLRTDQMLAPKQDFTASVMQQILVNQHLKGSARPFSETRSVELQESKVISFEDRRKPTPAPRAISSYLLRYASVAAVLMIMVGVGVYLNVVTGTGNGSSTQAAVSGAISGFATLVVESFQSPLLLVLGLVLATTIILSTWWYFRRSQTPR